MLLAKRVIVVTGATRGIGLAYARRFAEEGAAVVLADVRPGRASEITSVHPSTFFIQVDIRDPADTDRMAQQTIDRFGRIDVLVNNAGLFADLDRRPFDQLTRDEWEAVMLVNVVGTANCIRSVAPGMRAQKSGKIINIASNAVHKGLPLLLHYVASKGAVVAMTRALARELGEDGITVNAIAPGYVLHEATLPRDAGRNVRVMAMRALSRTETPEDLCGVAVFLASSGSDFITGQTIIVDGGEVFS